MQKYNIFWILFASLSIIVLACQGGIKKSYLLERESIIYENLLNTKILNTSCGDVANYIPNPQYLEQSPVRHIRMNFHFMYDQQQRSNFHPDSALAYVHQLLWDANQFLENGNQKMHLPLGNDTPVLPPRYRYVLATDSNKPNDQGVYFHYDDDLYWMLNKGKHENIYDERVFEKYGVRKGEALNVFLMSFPVDSLRSQHFKRVTNGVAIRNFIKIVGWYQEYITRVPNSNPPLYLQAWHAQKMLHHETGHIFTLLHAWNEDDACEDTPSHPNCFSIGNKPPCDTQYSNNLMDYNTFQHAITPCQIGRMQRAMSELNSTWRAMLEPTWCHFDEAKSIHINEETAWDGAKDLEGNIYIENGASLTIRCRVSLPKGAKIVVKPSGTLLLDGGTLHNACNEQWEGIERWKQGKQIGKIIMLHPSKILDMQRTWRD